MYNYTTLFLRKKNLIVNKKLNKKNITKYVNFRTLRSKYLKSIRDSLIKHNINAHLLDQAVSRCVAMYKSAISSYKNGHIKVFKVRTLKKTKRYRNLIIEAGLFSKVKNGFCITVLKEIFGHDELTGINKTCILTYDRFKSKYVLSVPIISDSRECKTRISTCGIDPGARSFLTVYSKNDVLQIGNDNIIFKKSFKKIDKLNTNFSTEESKQTRKYRKCIGKIHDKINNRVKDMHYKSAKYLCTHYDILKLGKISTKKIVSKITSNIDGKTKRLLLTLSHYKFREILINQAEKYGVKVKIVSEYNTTKSCSTCGKIKEVGKSKIYECEKCGMKAGRDVNAAKNIRYMK
jgi:IS605 OrfB family transposase